MRRSRKFSVPSLPERLLPRLGLLERFAAVRWPPTRLLLLAAGTGYGKTTLVADAIARSGQPAAWIMLDPEDQDLETFLLGLIQAVRQALPDFNTSATELLKPDGDPVARAMQATLALLEDLEEQLVGPLFVVLDDYHVVNSPAINRIVGRIIKYLPSSVRLVMTSRAVPDLEIGHLRAKGELTVWGEAELQLSLDEVGDLLDDLPKDTSRSLHERTEGWIAALLLYREALRSAPDRAPLHWAEFLDAYFEQEVLAAHAPEIQQFLLRASLLDTIDPAVCETALGLEGAAKAIAYLRQNHVFVLTDDEGTLRLHPLFRDFLLARLKREATVQEYARWSQALGQAHWEAGRALQAIDLWLGAGLVEAAVAAVETLAQEWSAAQRVSLLEGVLARLPEASIPPNLLLLYGDVLRQWGELERAMPLLEKARLSFARVGDTAREGRALTLLAACFGLQGQLNAMQESIEQALAKVSSADPATMALARIVQGNGAILGGQPIEQAIGHFEESLRLSRLAGDRYGEARALHNLGVAHTKLGQFAEAMARYDEGIALSAFSGGIPHFWMTPINRCLLLLYLGRADEAREDAQAVVEKTRHLRYAREEGDALAALAQADVQLGRFDEATESLRMAEGVAERTGYGTLGVMVHHVRSYLAFAQGRFAEALDQEDRALEASGTVEMDARHLEFAQFRARILVALGRYDEASDLLERIFSWLEQLPFRFHLVEAHLTASELQQALGNADRAWGYQEGAEAIAREHGYDLAALRARRGGTAKAAAPGPVPAAQGANLQLTFLGGFQATCRGRLIGAREWQSAKAKWLLAYLVEQPSGATKAHLLEALFDDEATDASVTMTVTRLRKALEPDLAPKAPSAYVLFQGGRYVFNALSSFSADTREFLKHLDAAAGPTEAAELEAALALYGGEFLPEFSDPWVESRRQYYQGRAIAAVKRLIALRQKSGDGAALVASAQRGLAIDPCDEELHGILISHYLAERQPHKAREQFKLCTEALAKAVGVEPSVELRRLVAGLA